MIENDVFLKPWEQSYNEQRYRRLSDAFYDYIDHDEAEAFLADLLQLIDEDKSFYVKKLMMLDALKEKIQP